MRDDIYLLKMKQAGASDESIATKLGLSAKEVQRIWSDMHKLKEQMEQSGYLKLQEQWMQLCYQYNLVGSSLKFIAGAVNNGTSPDKLREAIKSCPEGTDLAQHLLGKFIILNPYPAVQDPARDLNETLGASRN